MKLTKKISLLSIFIFVCAIGQNLKYLLISLNWMPLIKDSYKATYNGRVYYDFKVAQHTTDYHLWVSNNSNNWEVLNGYE